MKLKRSSEGLFLLFSKFILPFFTLFFISFTFDGWLFFFIFSVAILFLFLSLKLVFSPGCEFFVDRICVYSFSYRSPFYIEFKDISKVEILNGLIEIEYCYHGKTYRTRCYVQLNESDKREVMDLVGDKI